MEHKVFDDLPRRRVGMEEMEINFKGARVVISRHGSDGRNSQHVPLPFCFASFFLLLLFVNYLKLI